MWRLCYDVHKDRRERKWNGRQKCEIKHRFVVVGTILQAAEQCCKVTGKFWKICSKIRLGIRENEPSGNHNMSAFCATHMRAHVCWNWCEEVLLTTIWDRRAAQRHLLPLSQIWPQKRPKESHCCVCQAACNAERPCPRSEITRVHSARFSLVGRI